MIHLDGVSVPQRDEPFPGKYKPYDHQVASADLIRSHGPFFAVNESPTGSGKTNAWLLPTLDERIDTIAVYPTNALVEEQAASAAETIEKRFSGKIDTIVATGPNVAKWCDEANVPINNKGRAIVRKLRQSSRDGNFDSTILFTNPDTLTIARKDMYSYPGVSNRFDQFEMIVFDEFHLADVKQRDSLLFLTDEMYYRDPTRSNTDRFYFLSATPETEDDPGRPLIERLSEDVVTEDADASVHRISADSRPSSEVANQSGWREVMPAVRLNLSIGKTFRTADRLLSDERIDEFLEFCEAGRTIVMLDGVHEVDRIYDALSNRIDCQVERITGFNRGDVQRKLDEFDVLVSNSAVEVGLDVQPEQVLFSAHDAPTLIQRLGRLREKDDRTLDAWCFVPDPIHARLNAAFEETSPNEPVARYSFERAVRDSFGKRCDLSSFSRRWGELEAYHYVKNRTEKAPSDRKEQVLNEGCNRIDRHYYRPYGRSFEPADLERLRKDWDNRDVLEEMQSYRGRGLQVMVRDHDADEMKLYDLFYLLRWGDVRFLSGSTFLERLSEDEADFYARNRSYAVGFCEFFGRVEAAEDAEYGGRSVSLKGFNRGLYVMVNESNETREPRVLDGLGVRVDENDAPPVRGDISVLNDSMKEAERLCYAFPGTPSRNESVYGLDEFMFIYPFDNESSIALGTTALYMHCLVQDATESDREGRDWSW